MPRFRSIRKICRAVSVSRGVSRRMPPSREASMRAPLAEENRKSTPISSAYSNCTSKARPEQSISRIPFSAAFRSARRFFSGTCLSLPSSVPSRSKAIRRMSIFPHLSGHWGACEVNSAPNIRTRQHHSRSFPGCRRFRARSPYLSSPNRGCPW